MLIPLSSCVRNESVNQPAKIVNSTEYTKTEPEPAEKPAIKDPLRLRAEEIALSLDNNQLAAQVLISGIDGRGSLHPDIRVLLEEYPAGGIMLFRYNLNTENEEIISLINETVSLIVRESGIPPFIAVDHEGGNVNRFNRGVADLPSASFYWNYSIREGRQEAFNRIEADSARAGRAINNLGVNMNFAPVAEYLNDDNREFLRYRSYGSDLYFTSEAAAAFARGMTQSGVLCVVKHFPGSAGEDPHYSPSVLNIDKPALDSMVYPFASLIKKGARAVMAAHTSAPAVDSEIASLSSVIMENWLREELGFTGIIISDDFLMAAAGDEKPEDAAIRSVAAGADMILVWPGYLRRTHRAFISALDDGRLSKERLLNAAQRIIYEKLLMGLLE